MFFFTLDNNARLWLDKFEDSRIVAQMPVRVKIGDSMVKNELTTEDIVITVADKPVALAGVMAALQLKLTNTLKMLFSKLYLDLQPIRKTSSRL